VFMTPTRIKNSKFKNILALGIDDSKRLTPKIRSKLAADIKDCCQDYALASESAATINRIGIVKATERAMRRAIRKILGYKDIKILRAKKAFVLIDGFHVKYLPGIGLKQQKNIFDGDRKCLSIAAASIIAKVHRDDLMGKLGSRRRYKKYGWEKNKGYGTKDHIKAIKKYGLTKLHRKLFVRKIVKN